MERWTLIKISCCWVFGTPDRPIHTLKIDNFHHKFYYIKIQIRIMINKKMIFPLFLFTYHIKFVLNQTWSTLIEFIEGSVQTNLFVQTIKTSI